MPGAFDYLGTSGSPASLPAALGVSQPMATGGAGPISLPPAPSMPQSAPPVVDAFGAPAPLPSPGPADMQYENETQADGTVLIRIKNPDGSLGPVVDIWKPKGLNKGSK